MLSDFDRIRILWIDDLPGGQTSDLQAFSQYFQIVGREDKPCWIRSIDDYEELLAEYHHCKSSSKSPIHLPLYFPVEIISADYDLSKFSGNERVGVKNFEDLDDSSFERPPTTQKSQTQSNNEINYADFDGCIINMMYLSEFSNHPCGSVVTTYQEPQLRNRAAKILESHMERIYGIDLSYSATRRWDRILSAGVVALRKRIKSLYINNKIVLSVSDLIAMADGLKQSVLTLKSEYAVRRLPVDGLFIDFVDSEEKVSAVKKWSSELLSSKVSRENYKLAEEIAGRIWDKYNDDELVEAYQEFSKLHISIYSIQEQKVDVDEKLEKNYEEWALRFGLKKTNRSEDSYQCMSDLCLDISSVQVPGDKSSQDLIIRWSVIFLILKLLNRILICVKKVRETAIQNSEQETQCFSELLQPCLDTDDILLLLYPVPKSPFPLPWHFVDSKTRFAKKEAWYKWLSRKQIKLQGLLDGTDLTEGERCLLQGIVLNEAEYAELDPDPQTRLDLWSSWVVSKQFLFGS